MNNNYRITLNPNKNIIVEFTNERIIPASGLDVVGALFEKSDLNASVATKMRITKKGIQKQTVKSDCVVDWKWTEME